MDSDVEVPAKRPRKVTHGPVAQEQILQAVDELFYREGARAVSVDAVVKRAGVNKMSVYRQFASKEDLLLHYLARRDENFWEYFNGSLAKHPGQPAKQLVQFFTDLAARAGRPGYRGCPFVNIAAEFPDPEHPARQMVAQNKALLMARLLELATQAGAKDAQALANGLALLIEGAYAASQTYEPGHPLLAALPQVAQAMVDGACVS
jgi:AcrR family transcriptional regulator